MGRNTITDLMIPCEWVKDRAMIRKKELLTINSFMASLYIYFFTFEEDLYNRWNKTRHKAKK
jgi:hypothetical protein